MNETANDLLHHLTWALYAGAAVGGFVVVKSAFFVRRGRKLDAIEAKLDATLDTLEDVAVEAPAH